VRARSIQEGGSELRSPPRQSRHHRPDRTTDNVGVASTSSCSTALPEVLPAGIVDFVERVSPIVYRFVYAIIGPEGIEDIVQEACPQVLVHVGFALNKVDDEYRDGCLAGKIVAEIRRVTAPKPNRALPVSRKRPIRLVGRQGLEPWTR